MVIISEIRHFLPRLFLDIRAREGCCRNLEFYLLWPSFHAAEEKRRLEIVFWRLWRCSALLGILGLLRQGEGSWVFILGAEVFLLLLCFELLCCEFYSNLGNEMNAFCSGLVLRKRLLVRYLSQSYFC